MRYDASYPGTSFLNISSFLLLTAIDIKLSYKDGKKFSRYWDELTAEGSGAIEDASKTLLKQSDPN